MISSSVLNPQATVACSQLNLFILSKKYFCSRQNLSTVDTSHSQAARQRVLKIGPGTGEPRVI
jgi:hypothetical protein